MRRARDGRLARLAKESTRLDSTAGLEGRTLRAWNTVRAVVRDGLLRAGIDPERAAALRQEGSTDERAQFDTEVEEAPALRDDDGLAGEFTAKIADIARRFEDGHEPDFASASLAELLAWCLHRREPCDR